MFYYNNFQRYEYESNIIIYKYSLLKKFFLNKKAMILFKT